MTTEAEDLLSRAAQAAGIHLRWGHELPSPWVAGVNINTMRRVMWNPLTDDGDALRLAARLRIIFGWYPGHTAVWARHEGYDRMFCESYTRPDGRTDQMCALRHAIVRAAADMGVAS